MMRKTNSHYQYLYDCTLDKVPCPTAASLLDWESFTDEQIAALEAQVLILSDLVCCSLRTLFASGNGDGLYSCADIYGF